MEITKWEYKRIPYDDKEVAKLGKQGWEAVGTNSDCHVLILKRPCGRLQVIEKVNGVPINQEQDRSDGIER